MSFLYTTPGTPTLTSLTYASVSFNWAPSSLIANGTAWLLHMDGTNGSTTFIDSSGNGNTVSVSGSASIETSIVKFGTGAMNQPSTSTASATAVYSNIAQNSVLDILSGTTDFTVDGWFYIPSGASSTVTPIIDYGSPLIGSPNANTGGFQIIVDTASVTHSFRVTANTNSWAGQDYGPTITNDAWHHFAITRASGQPRVFLDGVLLAVPIIPAWTGYTFPSQPSVVQVGALFGVSGQIAPARFDEVRVVKGTALWTASFTPPTSPAPDPGPPPAYTVFRNGSEIGQVLTAGVTSYTDALVIVGGTYSYKIAAQDGSDNLVSDYSGLLAVTIPPRLQNIYGKFVGSAVYKAVEISRVGDIIPRIWPSKKNNTVYG
jgi:Concanavalin A-like lectin/glucanases superfamily